MSSALTRIMSPDFAHAPLQEVRHPELRPDAAAVLLGVSELKRRAAPDHLQSRELRERGDQILRDPVGEVLLARLPAFVRERQHRDGGRARNEPGFAPLSRSIPRYPSASSTAAATASVQHSLPPAGESGREPRGSSLRDAAGERAGSGPAEPRPTADAGRARQRPASVSPAGKRVHCTSRNRSGTCSSASRCIVDDDWQQKRLVAGHDQCDRSTASFHSSRKYPSARVVCVPRDHRDEQCAVLDLPADRLVPGIPAAQLAPIEPDLDTGCAQRLAILCAASTSCEA